MGQTVRADCRDHLDAVAAHGPVRIAALVQRGRRGRRVLLEVLAVAEGQAVEVTLVTVVVHATGRGCAVSAAPLNEAIDEAASADLDSAAMWLPLSIPVVDRRVMCQGVDVALAEWVAQRGFDLVLLPGRRGLRGLRAPAIGGGLAGLADVDVRVV